MKIAMITSEANPLCKSGGLADVTYSLSRELNANGVEAVIVLPYYKQIKNNPNVKANYLRNFNIAMSWRNQYCGVFETVIDGIKYYLLDNEYYFNRDGLYGFNDDGERFAFFSLAALQLFKELNYRPDIIHVHDWQAGMIPCLLKEKLRNDEFFKGVKSVLTIHNPAFKGFIDKYFLNNFYGLDDYLYDYGNVRFEGMVSTLKAAIYYADMITTVSPTHRNELLTYTLSHKLNYCLELRKDDFVGIVNGVDEVEFNPAKDNKIAKQYTSSAFVTAKKADKNDMMKEFHLSETTAPTFGIVSRLTFQKGIDLVLSNAAHILGKGGRIIVLGSGEHDLEVAFQKLRDANPDNVGIYIGYNDALAHKVYAGCDFFLMPSSFEPCGIGQIIAQRYGTLPIVRETGGLVDTVEGYFGHNAKTATGFSFKKYDSVEFGEAINRAFDVYGDKKLHSELIKNAMKLDHGWKKSMEQYLEVYRKAMKK